MCLSIFLRSKRTVEGGHVLWRSRLVFRTSSCIANPLNYVCQDYSKLQLLIVCHRLACRA